MLSFHQILNSFCNETIFYVNISQLRPPTTSKYNIYSSPLRLNIHQQLKIHSFVTKHNETLLFILIHLVFHVHTIFSSGLELRHATKWFAVLTQIHLQTLYSTKNYFHKHCRNRHPIGLFIATDIASGSINIRLLSIRLHLLHRLGNSIISSQDAQKTRWNPLPLLPFHPVFK
jgi:hypothetical protein